MLYRELRASRMITLLAQLGIKSAKTMSMEDACREYARLRRSVEGTKRDPMPLGVLVDRSAKRRRARQTHPGKR